MAYGYAGNMERYDRQLRLWGREAQEKLRQATVLVVGVGGLGSIASLYLTLAGVGHLILVDRDAVEPSNLNRQVLYTEEDIGKPKALVAAERLSKLNPDVRIEAHVATVSRETIEPLVKRADVVIDGLDNWSARLVLDELCWKHRKPFVHAGIHGMYGQLTTIIPGKTPCLRCIVRNPRDPQRPIPVVGVTPGVVGTLAATEAIKLITGYGETLAGHLLIIDLANMEFTKIKLEVSNECIEACEKIA
ncbi:UBA/THIF-type NAD/FAD binding protein [Pyrolobus fumarii 1A]|uniref:UBA/THIF-type NAD/FAD binding protein n=1 Tax=Pyrolobus fumarii (strain DSM 11204 / 1A) TaxID=694429 RepID=G0EF02_PYRF1|nr:HesA/MoeB/ThiF family protein [Pyrolobus fumarii]AEM38116.1 UBA/THIF-type NAD/FAD binding protein [Pyrolobus fumarii 1A]